LNLILFFQELDPGFPFFFFCGIWTGFNFYFFGLVRIDQGIKKFNFFKLSSGSQIGQFSHIQ
jgi:hypothetical protein